MFKAQLAEHVDRAEEKLRYKEMDPLGRYGRFKDILGKGATKTVYKAFDVILGMEVAWNQVNLNVVFRSPEELQRLYSEVHVLKNLDHHSIMRFYASWIDVDRCTFNFITEMFTSGTLREYRRRHKRVNIWAIKNWARQVLEGLAYLHGQDPPVIHRDIKCDNIFVNGHLGQVKIGDLGLAAVLRGSHHAHSVIGTPEFMAPELYDEDYNERVDIYAFGMCLLEMLTSEYPYSECSNPAQIYKKVTSGKLPEAFHRIGDIEARRFVKRCLETASFRPSASELLMDSFLADNELEDFPVPNIPLDLSLLDGSFTEISSSFGKLMKRSDMTITGTMNQEDDTIFLKVKISYKDGEARNVYFPFDITCDYALEVATEMVKELEINDWEPNEIAAMIDDEISAFAPNWKSSTPSQNLHLHSFSYDECDDDDDDDNNPFYSLSSRSSSQASLPFCKTQWVNERIIINSARDWLQEDINSFGDPGTPTSLNSYDYNDFDYISNLEKHSNSKTLGDDSLLKQRTSKCTRFCPGPGTNTSCKNKYVFPDKGTASSTRHEQKVTRGRSMVDVRSQMLHRSLVEEVHKRRLFKTVGSVENIGYHEPNNFSGKAHG